MCKKIFLVISLLSSSLLAFSQDIDGIYKLFFYGKDKQALGAIKDLAAKDPTNLNNQFYLYNFLNANGQFDEAKTVLDKLINNDESKSYKAVAELLAQVNSGRNGEEMADDFAKALRRGKRAKGFLSRMIGEQFMYGKHKDAKMAIFYIKQGVDDFGMDDATTRMLLGDAYALKGDAGNAVTNYEYAAEKAPDNAVPHYKIGRAYLAGKNYDYGIPEFEKAIAADPTYALVYRDLGYYYYALNKYPEAKQNFKKYMELNAPPSINDRLWYANTLFLNRDYPEAVDFIKAIQQEVPNKAYLDRLLAYTYCESKDYPNALQSMDKFLADHDTTPIISRDYEYLGRINMGLDRDSIGGLNWLQAYKMDSTKLFLIQELADTLYERKKYAQAGYYFNIVAKATNKAVDYFYATRADYLGNQFGRGDTAAMGIITKVPDDPTGYLWRARHNVQMDTTGSGAAVPFYTKVIELGGSNVEKYKQTLSEAANWLTAYYINKGDYKTANSWNDKAFEFDDANQTTLNYMNVLSEQMQGNTKTPTPPATPETPKAPEKKDSSAKKVPGSSK